MSCTFSSASHYGLLLTNMFCVNFAAMGGADAGGGEKMVVLLCILNFPIEGGIGNTHAISLV